MVQSDVTGLLLEDVPLRTTRGGGSWKWEVNVHSLGKGLLPLGSDGSSEASIACSEGDPEAQESSDGSEDSESQRSYSEAESVGSEDDM